MNPTNSFSQFAYKALKPRLTFYERRDKENHPDVPPTATGPHSPINASQGSTPTGKTVSVVPETPDDERPVKRRSTSANASMATGRRKRCRLPSSSASEVEAEDRVGGSHEKEHGGARGTKSGLFSFTVVSKRQKRSGEPSFAINESAPPNTIARNSGGNQTEKEQSLVRPWKASHHKVSPSFLHNGNTGMQKEVRERSSRLHFRRRVACSEVVDLCTDTDSEFDSSQSEEDSVKREVFEVKSDSETESDLGTIGSQRQRCKPTSSIPSLSGDGWLSRRTQSKPQPKPVSSFNSTCISDNKGDSDLSRLRELFPGRTDNYLMERLVACADIDGAIASILASDDPSPSPKRRLRASKPRARRLRLPSDDSVHSPPLSSSSGGEDLPDINCASSVVSGRKAVRRGGRRLVLNESLDEATPLNTQHRNTHRVMLLSSNSGSEGEGEGEREGEGDGEGEEEKKKILMRGKDSERHSEKASSHVSRTTCTSSSGHKTTQSKLQCFVYSKSANDSHHGVSAGGKGGGKCEVSGGCLERREAAEEAVMSEEEEEEVSGGRCEEVKVEEEGCEEGRVGEEVSGLEEGKVGICKEGGDGTGEHRGQLQLHSEEDNRALPASVIELSDSENSTQHSGVTNHCDKRDMRDVSPDLEILEGEFSDESHYSDEDDFSDKQKKSILELLNSCSQEEACAVPGCSDIKASLLLAKRPFPCWEHLLEVISTTKGLSERLLDGCVRLLEERRMLARLLSKCQNISSSIARLVDAVREEKENKVCGGSDAVIHFTLPKMLSPDVVLKPYQTVGVSWLALLHSQNLNAILADEMGLGKTVQAIAFLSHLYEHGWKRPHLIVVPTSTLDNWARELATWSPSLNVLTYWGSICERAAIRDDVIYGDLQDHYDVILSTYTVCIGRAEDRKFFRKLQLKSLVLDEGHMLKNMSTLKYTHLMRMQAERRLLLTGTPLQNNLLELMSLLSFVMPSVFRPYLQPLQTAFRHSCHTTEIGSYYTEQVSRAKEIMRPFILRRLKKEVLHQLPDKLEIVEHCPLTPEQWSLYCSVVEQGMREMKDGSGKELTKSMTVLTNLRKAANHPLLLRNHYSDDIIASMSTEILKEEEYRDADCKLVEEDMSVMTDFELNNLCLQHQSLQQYCLPAELIRESGKLKYLEKKLIECKEQDNRVLVFSQFTMLLDVVEVWLQLLGHTHLRLDGSTPMSERQALIDLYNSDAGILVFLLSTKAGGLGINLTSANVVVLHDIDFNPYNDKQAEDRCHRVGQTREVQVVRLVARDTVEEEILKCAEQKLKLEQDMTAGNQLGKTDIAFLLGQSLKLSQT